MYLTVVGLPQNRVSLKGQYSIKQLMGDNSVADDAKSCIGYHSNHQMGRVVSITGLVLNPDDKAIPCGRLPLAYPKGDFKVYNLETNMQVPVRTEGIVSPILPKFSNIDPNKQWLDLTDPRFANWMDVSPSK